jgi:hypothetical protein
MKLLPILCAGLLASAAFAVSVDVASAAVRLNSSKSNIYKLAPNDPNAEQACTDGGGTVSTDKDGNKICTKPEAADASSVKSSKSNTSD